jgi:hypothetical protein
MTDAARPVHIPNCGQTAIWSRRFVLVVLTFVAYESLALPHCWTEDEHLTSDKGVQLTADDRRTLLTSGRKIRQCEPMRNSAVNLLRTLIP